MINIFNDLLNDNFERKINITRQSIITLWLMSSHYDSFVGA